MNRSYFNVARFLYRNCILQRSKNLILFCVAMSCTVISALMEGLAYFFMIGAFSALIGDKIEFNFLPAVLPTSFVKLFLLGFASQILKSALGFAGMFVNSQLSEFCQCEIQNRIYEKIMKLSYAHFNQYKTGELADYAIAPSMYLRNLLESFYQFIAAATLVFVSSAILFFLSWSLTLCIFGSVGGILFVQKRILKKVLIYSGKLASKVDIFSSETIQNLCGMRLIHLYNQNHKILEKIAYTVKKGASYSRKLSVLLAFQISFNEIIGIVLVGAALFFGFLILNLQKAAVLPILLSFMAITYRLSGRMQIVIQTLNEIGRLQGFVSQVMRFLDQDAFYSAHEENETVVFQKSIKFNSLNFSYPSTNKRVIHQFSCNIPKGSIVALIGKSGAGKSTILDLLTGLYLPSEGDILIDEKKLKSCHLKSWREKIGIVSQDAFIFNDTIEMNIRLGKENATLDEIIAAAKKAHADEFITNFPDGYQTVVGERGHCLSGGERQRLALARALIRDPEIIILDEATSHLDAHSETLIQDTFKEYCGSKTLIIVAHRLSTVMYADIIFFLEKGRIVESGSHHDLLGKRGRYAAFWEMQACIKKQEQAVEAAVGVQ